MEDSCCAIREAELVLFWNSEHRLPYMACFCNSVTSQTTHQLVQGDLRAFSSSFHVLFQHGSRKKTFLHDLLIIDWEHPCRMALQKNVQHWIMAHNIRPVSTAKKILSPWCHYMKCSITDHVTTLWENSTEFAVNHPWPPQEAQSWELNTTSLS